MLAGATVNNSYQPAQLSFTPKTNRLLVLVVQYHASRVYSARDMTTHRLPSLKYGVGFSAGKLQARLVVRDRQRHRSVKTLVELLIEAAGPPVRRIPTLLPPLEGFISFLWQAYLAFRGQ